LRRVGQEQIGDLPDQLIRVRQRRGDAEVAVPSHWYVESFTTGA
jgi:hypothetical protein